MGFIKAFSGAFNASLADQWKEFYIPRSDSATMAVYPVTKQSQNNGVGENTKGSSNIITNGSKFVVLDGTALVTVQDGALTGYITEPGGYEYRSDDPNSKSVFAGDGFLSSTIGQSWERMKFGGQPASQQLAFYINLKELPGIRFGTQGPIYWYDAWLKTQAGGVARGRYSLKIQNPLEFFKAIPDQFKMADSEPLDFNDVDNEYCSMLFDEFVGCLPGAFKDYTADPAGHTIMDIKNDQVVIAKLLQSSLDTEYEWSTRRGLELLSVTIAQIEYDKETADLIAEARAQDFKMRGSMQEMQVRIEEQRQMGNLYQENMAGMVAMGGVEASKVAAGNEAGALHGFMGMNLSQMQANNMMGTATTLQATQQGQPAPTQPVPGDNAAIAPGTILGGVATQAAVGATAAATVAQQPAPAQPAAEDPYAKLASLKQLLDQGVITQADFDAAKNKLLGI